MSKYVQGVRWLPAMCAAVIMAALPMVQQWEGTKLRTYLDMFRVVTGCSGVTRSIEPSLALGQEYSPDECAKMDLKAITVIAAGIKKCVPDPATFNMQVAMLVAAYNIGVTAFCGSSMSRLWRAGDPRGACNALLLWNKAGPPGHKVSVRGLTNRRSAERAVCLKDVA